MGKYDLDNYEYDEHLARKKRSRSAWKEVRDRQEARKSKGYSGWHFGLGNRPVHTKDKAGFQKELEKRGLMMKDEVKKPLR